MTTNRTDYMRRWRAENGYSICKILIQHKEDLKNDPDRLTTDFIKGMTNAADVVRVRA